LVSLVKNSSLVSTIGMVELMFVANDIAFNNFRTFEITARRPCSTWSSCLASRVLARRPETRMARAA